MKSDKSNFTEKCFTLVVYNTENGKVISVSPMSDRIKMGDNIYLRLEAGEADMLRGICKGFTRMPVVCVLDGKSVIVVRSFRGRFDMGILFIFDDPIENLLTLAEMGKLDLVAIDKSCRRDGFECGKELSDAEVERISSAYRLMLNSLYNIDVDKDVSGAIQSLADLAGCRVLITEETCAIIHKMDEQVKNDLLTMLFLIFLFAARESLRREVEVSAELRYGEPVVILLSELLDSDAFRYDEELCEFLRIAERQDMLIEGVDEGLEGIDNTMRIELNPKTFDLALLGIKLRPQLED